MMIALDEEGLEAACVAYDAVAVNNGQLAYAIRVGMRRAITAYLDALPSQSGVREPEPAALPHCADKMLERFVDAASGHFQQDIINAAQRLIAFARTKHDRYQPSALDRLRKRPADEPAQAICDCEHSANGLGLMGRECDCLPSPDATQPTARPFEYCAGCDGYDCDPERGCAYPMPRETFQARVQPWMLSCFGEEISSDRMERNHRFLEEALELVQANGCTRDEARQLVDYTFDRPTGDVRQEIGGVMVTLAALCLAIEQDMHAAGEAELARIWTKVEQIRAKQAAKPKHSPLPEATQPREQATAMVPTGIDLRADEHLGEMIYRALYEHEGGKWEAVEPRYIWFNAAARLRAALAASRSEGDE